jgi:sialic acid synthase SpsE
MTCFIVAEIGVNAGNNIDTAKQLIDYAVKAGASSCKFQMWGKDRFPAIEHLRLTAGQLLLTKEYAEHQGLQWFCTPFDETAIEFLSEIGMKIWKVPSGRVTDEEHLKHIASKNPEWVIMSLGKGHTDRPPTSPEIFNALSYFPNSKKSLMYCVSEYPTPPEHTDLQEITLLQNVFPNHDVGFSDHSTTIELPVAAITLGVTVIEKHLTLDRKQEGPDHKASLESAEFSTMCRMIRNVEKALK